MIRLSEKDLHDYDAEIIHLQSLLIRVKAQRKRLNHYKAQLESYFSPFRKLPNKLMELIFESTCKDNLLQEYPWPLNSQEQTTKLSSQAIIYLPALAVSAVCTHWRSLALTLPQLWSRFRVEMGSQQKESFHMQGGFISTLQLYLYRSADSPLQIDTETKGILNNQSTPPVLKLLLEYSCRWQRFSYTSDYDLTEWFPKHVSFPILEDLSLTGCDLDIQSDELDCFECAPNLRAIKVHHVLRASHIPWNQLVFLDIQRLNLMDIHLCQNLTTLILRSYASPNSETISLAKLESLTLALSTRDRGLLGRILDACIFPSLSELIIAPSDTGILVWPVRAFDAFISRSSCILTSLSISGVKTSDVDLLAVFRILPYLLDFAFDDYFPPGEQEWNHPITSLLILRMHASSINAAILLPKLRSLFLTLPGTSFNDAALISMISSRWLPDTVCAAAIGVDCFRSLVLRFREREVDEENYGPLYDLDRMGMRVVVARESAVVTES